MGKLSKDRRDIYYRKAKEEGYRARSAYKLLQLDDQFHIFKNIDFSDGGFRAVDLCAAPGSWSQVIQRRLWEAYNEEKTNNRNVSPPLVVAVDLQEMSPIEGVVEIQGDITSKKTASEILSYFGGLRAHVVVCDGAPDVTGMHDIDEYIQSQLLFAAVRMAVMLLQPGATFIAKVFRGETAGLQFAQLRVFFQEVYCCKPASSRVSSFEAFVVCKNFRYPPGLEPSQFPSHAEFQEAIWNCVSRVSDKDAESASSQWGAECDAIDRLNAITVPFISCGDFQGFDSDTTYCLDKDHAFLLATQPPINPPYKEAVESKRGNIVAPL